MKIKKTSLISYLLILSMILTSLMPVFAQETEEITTEETAQEAVPISEEVEDINRDYTDSQYDINNPDSILYGSDVDETYDEQAISINENIEMYAENDSDVDMPDEEDESFKDVSHMSDEEFFGVWDYDTNSWRVEGKLNYDYSPDLAEVERLVKLNS